MKKYAQSAQNRLGAFIEEKYNKPTKRKLMTQDEVLEHNKNLIKQYDNGTSMFDNKFICQCFGCRNRLSPNYLELFKEEVEELIDKEKLFCLHCHERGGESVALTKFLEAFPRAFISGEHATDESRLPQEAFEKFKNWNEKNIIDGDCVSSLYVYGASGTGKSRMASLIALNNINHGVATTCLRGGAFAQKLRQFIESGNSKSESAWLESLTKCTFLLFDDFGRDKLTPTQFEKLWQVLDARLGNRTTVFLSNFTPNENPNLDDSLRRRLQDFGAVLEVKR